MQKSGKYYWINVTCYVCLVVGEGVIFLSAASAEFGFGITWSTVGIAIGGAIGGFSNGIGVTTSLIALSEFFTLKKKKKTFFRSRFGRQDRALLRLKANKPGLRQVSNASRSDQAVATACSYLFRSLGSTTGMSLSSTAANLVLRARLHEGLGSGSKAEAVQNLVRKSLAHIQTLEPDVRDVVRRCYGESAQAAFAVQMVLVAGAAASAWFVREKALSS